MGEALFCLIGGFCAQSCVVKLPPRMPIVVMELCFGQQTNEA